jgi:CheY-like chemotaxis protein
MAGRGELILLAEDEELVRRAATRILERHGYRVIGAEDGERAAALFDEHQHDVRLVITDVVMPRMGGRRLVEHVRAAAPAMPVLCTSGYAERIADVDRTLPPDVPFIHKPWRSADLLQRVRGLLDAPPPVRQIA